MKLFPSSRAGRLVVLGSFGLLLLMALLTRATDLLWRNTSSAAGRVWLMNGVNYVNGVSVPTETAGDWAIVATGDCNGDGKTDSIGGIPPVPTRSGS